MAAPEELLKSNTLCSSLTFGSRQSPAALPSVRPWLPPARELQIVRPCGHVTTPKRFASCSQVSPVSLSVTVPFPLSAKRGVGEGRPAWNSPSCPVPTQLTRAPLVDQHRVCPVLRTRDAMDGEGAFWICAMIFSPVCVRRC